MGRPKIPVRSERGPPNSSVVEQKVPGSLSDGKVFKWQGGLKALPPVDLEGHCLSEETSLGGLDQWSLAPYKSTSNVCLVPECTTGRAGAMDRLPNPSICNSERHKVDCRAAFSGASFAYVPCGVPYTCPEIFPGPSGTLLQRKRMTPVLF